MNKTSSNEGTSTASRKALFGRTGVNCTFSADSDVCAKVSSASSIETMLDKLANPLLSIACLLILPFFKGDGRSIVPFKLSSASKLSSSSRRFTDALLVPKGDLISNSIFVDDSPFPNTYGHSFSLFSPFRSTSIFLLFDGDPPNIAALDIRLPGFFAVDGELLTIRIGDVVGDIVGINPLKTLST
jgi:hypothetical protein